MSISDFIQKNIKKSKLLLFELPPPPPKTQKSQTNDRKQNRPNKARKRKIKKAESNKEQSSECVIGARVCPYRGHLHHLQLYVLWL